MTNLETSGKVSRDQFIVAVLSAYNKLSFQELLVLVNNTTQTRCQFIKIAGYSSDVSNNTELADQLVNIGVNYANQVKDSQSSYATFDLSKIDVEKHNFSGYSLRGVRIPNPEFIEGSKMSKTIKVDFANVAELKAAVRAEMQTALEELKSPTHGQRVNNDISIDGNKTLFFNLNTQKLSIRGQSENKSVHSGFEGTFKVVASAPRTIAKNIIKAVVMARTAKIRRFSIDNLIGTIKIKGNVLELA